MTPPPFRIKSLGESAILLEWPAEVRLEILRDILRFTDELKTQHLGLEDWEYVPIYHSLCLIRRSGALDHKTLGEALLQWYAATPEVSYVEHREWQLPVCYDPEFGPDLQEAAQSLGLTEDELIQRHTQQAYPVFGIGFLPGFVYLGGVPEVLQLPRRPSPRMAVPRGSVGLADRQTGIYPQQSPGGWHILGNCPIPLFDPERDPPCFIELGDSVRFRAVSRAEYELHRIEAEVGIYDFDKKYGNAEG